MFGQARPVVFDPYRRRRSAWRPPRWLVLLFVGVVVGAVGVVVVQQRYLPPRLSAEESVGLRQAVAHADSERQRLDQELHTVSARLEVALAEGQRQATELADSRASVDALQRDLDSLVATLPPDPRSGDVQVRAGRFSASDGLLSYDLVLTRSGGSTRPIDGVLRLVVAGATQGRETTVALKPVALKVGSHAIVRGSARLPDGFAPKQTTVTLLDRSAAQLGMRVMLVQ